MPFSRVLIANRGEIAVRLIRACARLRLHSIAVFSDADRDAMHVQLADEAVNIGPAEARASYLDVEAILDAASKTGAQAIHPGYGFLAENAEFARRTLDAGLVFVGPSPEVIASMGAKIEAKRIAREAGVRCVPGTEGDDPGDDALLAEAKRIGTPLLIKASAGGGGRGMRRVDDLNTLARDLTLARQEARAAFGDPTILLERLIEAPRHIEVQILADRHGTVRHLFERDCSIQRNYQKIIEEAPAPQLGPELREQMLADAVKLATAIGYDNAGTIEFVVDTASDDAYFLEMNTRLQVEHPVTEMITGIDLVEWQLRIAAGEAISFSQEAISCDGWAVEARVAAEDPAQGYRPQTGTITSYAEPELADVRVDSGVRTGSEVTPYYDSMLAKVIAKGSDRDSALRGLRRALCEFRIAGIGVNTGFLQDVLALEDVQAGRHLTSCLTQAFPDGWQLEPITDLDLGLAALARHLETESFEASSPWQALGAWRLGESTGRIGSAIYHLRAGDQSFGETKVLGRAGSYAIEQDGRLVLELREVVWKDGKLAYTCDGRRRHVQALVDESRVTVHRTTGSCVFDVLAPEHFLLDAPAEAQATGNSILAPTPGLIADVLVEEGQPVEAGQPVIVLESMKLFQQLCAPVRGVLGTLHHTCGDTVGAGDRLATIDATDLDDAPPRCADD